MSSPITIISSGAAQSERAQSPTARSLPGTPSGLYIPVHRRGASTSSASSLPERESLSPMHSARRSPRPNARSISPMPVPRPTSAQPGRRQLDHSPVRSPITPRLANIPLASKIPNTYTLTELLSLHHTAALSPPQRAQVDPHVPFMLSRRLSRSSKSSSPTETAMSNSQTLDGQRKPDAPRRRRVGRKAPGAKARVMSAAVGADVEERRRRTAGWGWSAAVIGGDSLESESWRTDGMAVAAC